jgi:hypothetical protein
MLHYVRPRAQSGSKIWLRADKDFAGIFYPDKRLRRTLDTINEIDAGCPSDLKDYFTWISRAGNCPAINSFFVLGVSDAAFAE